MNALSLEFSLLPIGERYRPPAFLRMYDWATQFADTTPVKLKTTLKYYSVGLLQLVRVKADPPTRCPIRVALRCV